MKVNVLMITFNHKKFIREAIEGVLMQKTTFDFELVIGEDCSTDTTRDICLEYRHKYPNKIRLLLPEKNIGMLPNFIATLQSCEGKYIALCEGDDYWTDPYKLQKQVDFLEANPEYSMCFHDAEILNFKGEFSAYFTSTKFLPKEYYTDADFITQNFIPTASVVFRKKLIDINVLLESNIPSADWLIYVMLAQKGKLGYLSEKMSVWRQHIGGVYNGLSAIKEKYFKIKTISIINEYLKGKYQSEVNLALSKIYYELADLYFVENKFTESKEANLLALQYNPHNTSAKTLLLKLRFYFFYKLLKVIKIK